MDRLFHIVNGCYKHDRRSQRSFYERYYRYALRISTRYMDSYEEAAQLTYDTFLDIFRNFSRFKQVDKIKLDIHLTGWIKTKMIESIVHDLKAGIDSRQPHHLPDPFRSDRHPLFPETPALYGELIATIRELPPVLRVVFNLHVIDRYPPIEIANILGISLETTVSYIKISRQLCINPFLTSKNTGR